MPTSARSHRRAFYLPQEILRSVEDRLEALARRGELVDWLTFVPDGEPTLDANLGETIDLLRPLGIPVALITDGSLVWREDVRVALHKADWLSLKVDATDPVLWRRVNRPDPALHLDAILFGISRLAADYRGTLTTETMLVSGVNDSMDAIGAVADYLATIGPSIAYLAAPTRPPAEPGVGPPDDATLARAFQGTIASTKGHCPNRPEKRDKDRELRPDSPCEALRRALVSVPEYRYRRYASALPSYLEPPTILAIPDL